MIADAATTVEYEELLAKLAKQAKNKRKQLPRVSLVLPYLKKKPL